MRDIRYGLENRVLFDLLAQESDVITQASDLSRDLIYKGYSNQGFPIGAGGLMNTDAIVYQYILPGPFIEPVEQV
jgi:hypothetical protein